VIAVPVLRLSGLVLRSFYPDPQIPASPKNSSSRKSLPCSDADFFPASRVGRASGSLNRPSCVSARYDERSTPRRQHLDAARFRCDGYGPSGANFRSLRGHFDEPGDKTRPGLLSEGFSIHKSLVDILEIDGVPWARFGNPKPGRAGQLPPRGESATERSSPSLLPPEKVPGGRMWGLAPQPSNHRPSQT
jgi:hypothetical protein